MWRRLDNGPLTPSLKVDRRRQSFFLYMKIHFFDCFVEILDFDEYLFSIPYISKKKHFSNNAENSSYGFNVMRHHKSFLSKEVAGLRCQSNATTHCHYGVKLRDTLSFFIVNNTLIRTIG